MSRLTTTASWSLRTITHFSGSSGKSIYFLMRHVGRNVNEVSRSSLRGVFQMFAPPHAGAPAYDIDNALERSMMVRSSSGVRFDSDRPCPDFLGSDASVVDSRGTGHSGRLRSVLIQRIARNDPDAVALPFVFLIGHGVLLSSSFRLPTLLSRCRRRPVRRGRDCYRSQSAKYPPARNASWETSADLYLVRAASSGALRSASPHRDCSCRKPIYRSPSACARRAR